MADIKIDEELLLRAGLGIGYAFAPFFRGILEGVEDYTIEQAAREMQEEHDALEAATSGLQGIEAFCTANAIKYLWRWKLKNGEEDLQKAVWYINRLIQRAGADSAAGKELFNMKENKHGFEPKQEFTMGGIAWTVIQTGADWVKCIASDCVEERAFDEGNKNDFAASSLRAYLNGEFLRRLIKAGAPEEMFEYFNIDLTADDGLKNYGGDRVRIGLITCEEYRLLRGNIPALPDRWWWTATPDSPINSFVRFVYSDGSLSFSSACNGLLFMFLDFFTFFVNTFFYIFNFVSENFVCWSVKYVFKNIIFIGHVPDLLTESNLSG